MGTIGLIMTVMTTTGYPTMPALSSHKFLGCSTTSAMPEKSDADLAGLICRIGEDPERPCRACALGQPSKDCDGLGIGFLGHVYMGFSPSYNE